VWQLHNPYYIDALGAIFHRDKFKEMAMFGVHFLETWTDALKQQESDLARLTVPLEVLAKSTAKEATDEEDLVDGVGALNVDEIEGSVHIIG
jgi:hypothetical protein